MKKTPLLTPVGPIQPKNRTITHIRIQDGCKIYLQGQQSRAWWRRNRAVRNPLRHVDPLRIRKTVSSLPRKSSRLNAPTNQTVPPLRNVVSCDDNDRCAILIFPRGDPCWSISTFALSGDPAKNAGRVQEAERMGWCVVRGKNRKPVSFLNSKDTRRLNGAVSMFAEDTIAYYSLPAEKALATIRKREMIPIASPFADDL
ncbi:MAG: hypothetical protein NUV81_02795 [bacterium]|nr:hypothetical protein [bacterium]